MAEPTLGQKVQELRSVLSDAEEISNMLIRDVVNENAQICLRKALFELVSQAREIASGIRVDSSGEVTYDEIPF